MIETITIDRFLQLRQHLPVLDVRAPKEYGKGHIATAHNLPLFSNEEKAIIGTTYKNSGREPAILKGFDIVGPKWSNLIRKAISFSPQKEVIVHCWRGGMRSETMAWALSLYGFHVFVLEGGYKSYRHYIYQRLGQSYPLLVLSGMTGTHKTEILLALKNQGEQVVDLEGLAQHQGSAYGSMDRMVQPTQEQFENQLGEELAKFDLQKRIWVENESLAIGKIQVPNIFWNQIPTANSIEIQMELEQRVDFLAKEYGQLDKGFLIHATEKIKRRLGSQRMQRAIEAIKTNDMAQFVREILFYYDKSYRHELAHRDKKNQFVYPLNFKNVAQATNEILNFVNQLKLDSTNE